MDRVFDWLSVPLVARRTNNFEKKVLQALKSPRVSEVDDLNLTRTLTEGGTKAGAVLFTAMPYDVQRAVIGFAREMFADWGIEDVTLAFSFTAVGVLDDYLPSRQGGGADAQCYGRFDTAYFGKIMTAYTKFARTVLSKVADYAPRTSRELYATDIERNHAHTKGVVLEGKRAFDADGGLHLDKFDAFFVWVTLKNCGLIAGWPATAGDLGRALGSGVDADIAKALRECYAMHSMQEIAQAIDALHARL